MTPLDDLFQIQCGHCGHKAPVNTWCTRPILGDLPPGHFQCPNCQRAFHRTVGIDPARTWRGETIVLKPIPSVL